MNGLIDFLTTEEMIVVYLLIGIASVLYFIIYIFDKTYYKRKQRQNTKELNKIVEDSPVFDSKKEEVPVLSIVPDTKVVDTPVIVESVKEEVSTPAVPILSVTPEEVVSEAKKEVVPVIEKKEESPKIVPVTSTPVAEKVQTVPKKEEELQYTSIEPDPSEAQKELMKLTETLQQAEEEVKNIDLTAFEEEQEQNAIISLDELMKRNKALYESGQLEKLDDEGNEPISLQDLEARMNATKVKEEPVIIEANNDNPVIVDEVSTISTPKVEEAPRPIYQEHKKFKSSPVISPVFGIEKPEVHTSSDIELENTANYEKLDEEIRKTNEFLMTLKELQKKLD